jgi:hypothetical protein
VIVIVVASDELAAMGRAMGRVGGALQSEGVVSTYHDTPSSTAFSPHPLHNSLLLTFVCADFGRSAATHLPGSFGWRQHRAPYLDAGPSVCPETSKRSEEEEDRDCKEKGIGAKSCDERERIAENINVLEG